jgi:hypothetical protein
MKRSQRSRILFACFITGCLLVIVPFKLSWGNPVSQLALLAPVPSPNTLERNALNHRPLPLPMVQVPETVKRCVEAGGERLDGLGTVQDRGKIFYLLAVYSDFADNDPFNAADELIALDSQSGCTRLVDSQSVRKPLSLYLSSPAAQALEQQRFRRYIVLLGGIHPLQQKLDDRITAVSGTYLLSDEQVQALRQLHVQIPNPYRVLKPGTFPD